MVIKTASGIYMHAAWAEDEEGAGFSLTKFDTAQYVGHYSDKSAEESANWRKYEWQAIQEADDEEDDGTEIVEDESELDDEEEEEADGEIISSDDVIEGLMDDIGDTAEEVQSVGADSTATQNLSDTGLGNDNLLSGTNRGLAGWIIPDGFSAEAVAGTIYDDTADAVNYIKITCGTAGAGALQFDAGDLPEKLAHDGGSAYTLTADVAMSTCFSMPAYVGKPGGTANQIEFGTIDNAARDLEEDSENDGVWVPDVLTADALGVAADGQALCFDLTAMPAGATLEIANLKVEEGAMATPWKKSITEVAETAATAQTTADTAKADAATAQTTADTAVSNAATAQSTADTAKENAAAAQTGVDTLNTYIRSRDDGVEVARKDADGNYVGYKTIQTAGGLEVRTADDVVVAKYGKSVKIGENATSQVTIDSQTLQIITKLYKLYALSVKTRYIDTSTDVPVEFDKLEGGTVPFASSISFSVSVDPAVGEYYPLADFIIHASDGRYHAVMGVQSGISKTETCTAQKEVDDIGGGTVSGSLTFTAVYDGAKTFTLSNFSTSDIESVEWHVSYTVLSTEVPEVRIQGDSYISGRLGVSSRGETVDMSDGDVTLTGKVDASEGINTDGAITIKYKDIKEMFSGIISVGYEDKDLNLSAGGNTGDARISLSKDGYSARCICGWNLSGTGASNCTIARIYVNQTDQQAHYYVKNTGSSKATPTLRIYVLYTKNN